MSFRGDKMDQGDLASVAAWLHWLSVVKYVGGAMVVLGVAAELLGDWFSEPLQKKIDAAKDLKIAELQAIAPRVLPVPAQNRMREKLVPFAPLAVEMGTTKPLRHAFDVDSLETQIAGIFALAGWTASPGTTWGTDERPIGVWVSVREGENDAGTAADVIVNELKAAGIDAQKDPKPFAGPKPPMPPMPPDPSPDPPPSYATLPPDMAARMAVNDRMRAMSAQAEWKFLPALRIVIGAKQ
jgi:hypothetical protein